MKPLNHHQEFSGAPVRAAGIILWPQAKLFLSALRPRKQGAHQRNISVSGGGAVSSFPSSGLGT